MLSIFAINFDANMLQIKRNIFAYSSILRELKADASLNPWKPSGSLLIQQSLILPKVKPSLDAVHCRINPQWTTAFTQT